MMKDYKNEVREPQELEHNDIQLITPSEIHNYNFCPTDEEILKKIIETRG